MSVYGSDVEQLKALSRSLGQVAELLRTASTAVKQGLATTQWTGPVADKFKADWTSTSAAQLAAAAQSLTDQSTTVLKQAWEQATISEGGGLTGAFRAIGDVLGAAATASVAPGQMGGLRDVMTWLGDGSSVTTMLGLDHDLFGVPRLAEALTASGYPITGAPCTEDNPDGLVAVDGKHGKDEVLAALGRFQEAHGLPVSGQLDDQTRAALQTDIGNRASPYFAIQDDLAKYGHDPIGQRDALTRDQAMGTATVEQERADIFMHEYSRYRQGQQGDWSPLMREWFQWADKDPKMEGIALRYDTARQENAGPEFHVGLDPEKMLEDPVGWYVQKQLDALENSPLAIPVELITSWRGVGIKEKTEAMEAAETLWKPFEAMGEKRVTGE